MRNHNIIFPLNACAAFHKRQTGPFTNLLFSPLLFVFFPVLVWAAVTVPQLLFVFVSVFLLRVVLMFAGTQKPQRSEVECKRSDVPQRSGRKKDVIGKAPITSDRSLTIFNKQWQRHGQSGQSCDSTNILQPTNISARQKENPTTVPQWFELQMLCRCHSQSGFHSVLVMHVCWFNVAGFC